MVERVADHERKQENENLQRQRIPSRFDDNYPPQCYVCETKLGNGQCHLRGHDDPLLLEQALIVAECEVLLRSINSQSVQLVERLLYSVAGPIAKGKFSRGNQL